MSADWGLAILLAVVTVATVIQTTSGDPPYKVVCYFEAWAVYRNGHGKHDVEDIDPSRCTHLIYTFAGLSSQGTIRSLDPWNDLEKDYGRGAFKRFTKMKKRYPQLRTMLSIGGWNEGSQKYSKMASTPGSRKKFIKSVIAFLPKYGFDGLDVDWEYPTLRNGGPHDKENFASLIKELSAELKPRGWLLSAAMCAGKQTIDPAYDLKTLGKYLDFFNVMTYDYHGDWDDFVGHVAPLYLSHLDREHGHNFQYFSVNFTMHYYLEQGVDRSKLVMGFPIYGRGFVLEDSHNHSLYAKDRGPMAGCPYSNEKGFCGYNEICERIVKDGRGWDMVRDSEQKALYGWKGNNWLGWDDMQAVELKLDYLKSMKLGGAMLWAIDSDDFHGLCGGPPYPMLRKIWSELNGHVPTPATTIQPETTTSTGPTKPPKPTTPTKPTEPPPDPSHVCKHDGFNPDPDNGCSRFYYECSLVNGQWTAVPFECTEGTVFDPVRKVCNWPQNVPQCKPTDAPPV